MAQEAQDYLRDVKKYISRFHRNSNNRAKDPQLEEMDALLNATLTAEEEMTSVEGKHPSLASRNDIKYTSHRLYIMVDGSTTILDISLLFNSYSRLLFHYSISFMLMLFALNYIDCV